MPVPLSRTADDHTPVAWWEWALGPIVSFFVLLFILLLAAGALILIPFGFLYGFYQWIAEKRFRSRLTACGRLLDWPEVESRLKVGMGTLIVELRTSDRSIREWWTEDDLIAAAPAPLPKCMERQLLEHPAQIQEYAKECSVRYLNRRSGTAKLTHLPVSSESRNDSLKAVELDDGMMTVFLLPSGRALADKCPKAKVVTLLQWHNLWLLYQGDVETVIPLREKMSVANERSAYRATCRVIRSFDLSLETRARSVGELIDYVSSITSTVPNKTINIRRFPSSSELESEAFQRLQQALYTASGRIPESINSDLDPNEILPNAQRLQEWHDLGKRLQCDLPRLRRRQLIPFNSIADIVYYLVRKKEPSLDDSLCQRIDTTIHDYVMDVVAEEFKMPRDVIDRDFALSSKSTVMRDTEVDVDAT